VRSKVKRIRGAGRGGERIMNDGSEEALMKDVKNPF